jgi:predicted Zn-dependent protease
MSRYRKYQRKIRRYQKKLSRQKSKLKKKLSDFKHFIYKIGISSTEEFRLDKNSTPISFPSHLGVIFIGEFDNDTILFQSILENLEKIFPSFFFHIHHLGSYDFSTEVFSKGIMKELKDIEESSELLSLHPTNKFHQLIISKKEQYNLDQIIAITDLPLYSSCDNNIIFLIGEAHVPHQSCIVSTLKLRETFYARANNEKLFEERLNKEIIHEIGHLILGTEHCDTQLCVMSYSDTIEKIDTKSTLLCNKCRNRLRIVKQKYNF